MSANRLHSREPNEVDGLIDRSDSVVLVFSRLQAKVKPELL
jgi:hypothetical protein